MFQIAGIEQISKQNSCFKGQWWSKYRDLFHQNIWFAPSKGLDPQGLMMVFMMVTMMMLTNISGVASAKCNSMLVRPNLPLRQPTIHNVHPTFSMMIMMMILPYLNLHDYHADSNEESFSAHSHKCIVDSHLQHFQFRTSNLKDNTKYMLHFRKMHW